VHFSFGEPAVPWPEAPPVQKPPIPQLSTSSPRQFDERAKVVDVTAPVWGVRSVEFVVPDRLEQASIDDLRACVRSLKAARGALDAVALEVTAQIARLQATERGVHVVEVLKTDGGLSGPAAKKQSVLAEHTAHFPEAVNDLADGTLTESHLYQLVRAQQAHPEAFRSDCGALTASAAETSVDLFARRISSWIVAHDPDDGAERFNLQRERRRVSFKNNPDGTVSLAGVFDPEVGSFIQGAVTNIADELFQSESRRSRPKSTVGQRSADALAHLIAAGSGPDAGLGPNRRARVVLHVRCDLDLLNGDLERTTGRRVPVAETSGGAQLAAATVRRLACDAGVIPTVMGGSSLVLDVGRMRRTATAGQRSALEHRDQHCVFPGCDRPSHWCQVHHLKPWRSGGRTDLANLALLCSAHHHMVHEGGWDLRRKDTTWIATPRDRSVLPPKHQRSRSPFELRSKPERGAPMGSRVVQRPRGTQRDDRDGQRLALQSRRR